MFILGGKHLFTIEAMRKEDWPQVAEIYKQGLAAGDATFETEVPSYNHWDKHHIKACRYTAKAGREIVGWAALSPVSQRHVYRGVAEVSLYVHPEHGRKGIGRSLLNHLAEESKAEGFWMLQAVIFSENEASQALHQKAGFRKVGYREKIGYREGRWHDTVLMEKRNELMNFEEGIQHV